MKKKFDTQIERLAYLEGRVDALIDLNKRAERDLNKLGKRMDRWNKQVDGILERCKDKVN